MRSSVWLAKDHILLVEGSRVRETYKRVYLRDVQAMLIVKKTRFLIQAPVLFIPLALLIAVAALPAGWSSNGLLIAGLLTAAVLVYLYVAAFLYGCRLYLATAVGNVEVPSVFRLWQARRFGEGVRLPIAEAQNGD